MMFYRQMRRNASKIAGDRSAALELARGRLVVMSSFFAIIYMILAARAFDLTLIQGHIIPPHEDAPIAAMAEAQPEVMPRGRIFDRNGRLIATSMKMASLYADPALISDPDTTARTLVKIFPDLNYGNILKHLQSNKRFTWIKRNIDPAAQMAVMEIGEPGLAFEYEEKRIYPQKNSLAHLVGYTNVDGQGLAGIERSFNNLLAKGEDITLTVDVRLQHALRREVARSISDFNANAGTGVIMDVQTGEVLAGVSMPDFNPHEAGHADDQSRFNRLTLGVYELGSVFKIFSTAAFLETHDVPMSTTFDARESLHVGRHTISDYHAEDRIMTIPEVFMYSSNIGSAMMGQAVGTDRLQKFYADLGLLSALDFEISESASPLVPAIWRDINTVTASFGHGIAVTPVHVATAVASTVNGGYQVHPTLIRSGIENVSVKTRIMSEKTSAQIRDLLELTVEEGTGGKAKVTGYAIGGKTGTAEKSIAGGYDRKKLISSFVGVFPATAPRYVIFIAIDEPQGNSKSFGYATGGWVAAPAVGRVVASMVSILGVAPKDPSSVQNAHPLKRYIAVKG
jgi:cell division protein FtsI (penicillin-binding protein 3)